MNFKQFTPAIFLIPSLLSCEKITYFEPSANISGTPRALVHAAHGHSDFPGETMDAVKYGFSVLDGIEVDIQQSKNGTLWLSHDSKVYSVNGEDIGNFSYTSDGEIENIVSADSSFYYTRLEEVLEYMSLNQIKKHISLDVKRPYDIVATDNYADIADKIIELAEKYTIYNQILIESSSSRFLSRFNGNSQGIETYFFCLGDFDKGVAEAKLNRLTGISFKYNSMDEVNQELIDLLHASGLKMEIFYANDPEVIQELYSYGIDFLQTDNLDFYEYN